MKDSALMTSIAYLNDEYIAEADPTAAAPMKRLRRRLALRWTSLAAGLCAAFLLAWHVVVPYIRYMTLPEPPTYDHALYTADEIGGLFDTYKDNGGTSSYTKVYVPSAAYLDISKIPSGEYIDVYRWGTDGKKLDEAELTAFTDGLLERFSRAVNIPVPAYDLEREEATSYREACLEANIGKYGKDAYHLSASQNETYHYFSVRSTSPLGEIALNGVPVEVDQTMTDAEIVASLGEIKAQLFSVFGVTFEDVKIIRYYDEYSEHGATNLSVYFYNAADHPLNEYLSRPVSDNICLDFDNIENYSGDVVSDTVLSKVSIRYRQYRTDQLYTVSKRVRMISLQEAEQLLYNGYVFGGHVCPICMSQQSKVNFEGYDFVGLTYVFGYRYKADDSPTEGLPFYTFYKKIGRAQNGTDIYAMTYVPAVEVKGYEEYFEGQKKTHQS